MAQIKNLFYHLLDKFEGFLLQNILLKFAWMYHGELTTHRCLFYFLHYPRLTSECWASFILKMDGLMASGISLIESESEVTQSCPTLCDPWTVAHQAPPSMGFSRQEYWSVLPFHSPGDLPDPGTEPRSPTLQANALIIGNGIFFQFSSVIQLCPTLYDTMDCSMPSFPVHHQLPELTQTHVIESVMPSNHLILCCPLLLPPSIFPSISVFSTEIGLFIRWPKFWNLFQHQSFQWTLRNYFL